MYVDTHAHLNFTEFKDDLDEVVNRAKKAGVKKIIVPSSDIENGLYGIKICAKRSGLYPTIGVHPLHIKSGFSLMMEDGLEPTLLLKSYNGSYSYSCSLKRLKKLVNLPEVVGVGEIGLDYEKGKKVSRFSQKAILQAIIQATWDSGKPYIFHCRPTKNSQDAFVDLYAVLKKCSAKRKIKGVIHCFTGSASWAQKFNQLGFLVSYTGLITLTDVFDQAIKEIPLEYIMIETDAPLIVPRDVKYERAEPIDVIQVAKEIAQIKNIPLAEVEKQTTQNARELFKI